MRGLQKILLSAFVVGAMTMGMGMTVFAVDADTSWYTDNPSADTYTISDEADLMGLSDLVNKESSPVDFEGKTINLGDNITLTADFTPIGEDGYSSGGTFYYTFSGTFNGNDKTISADSNGKIGHSLYGNKGLFGYISSTATIQNVIVDVPVEGYNYVGGVVGRNYGGTVKYCTNKGTVEGSQYVGGVVGYTENGTVDNCINEGAVNGSNSFVGGVVGYNYAKGDGSTATVSNCTNKGTVNGTKANYDYVIVGGVVGYNNAYVAFGSSDSNTATVEDCNNEGTVTGYGEDVGGIVGENNASSGCKVTVTSCTNEGAVVGSGDEVGGVVGFNSGGAVTSCYNTGAIAGSGDVGGVVGYNYDGGAVTYCYNTGAVDGSGEHVGGVVGYNYSGTVTYCYNTGAVDGDECIGGVVGDNSGTVTTCYNTGAVVGSEDVGGVAGYNYGGAVTSCYNTGAVAGSGDVGGVVGANSGSAVTYCYYNSETAGVTDGIGLDYNSQTATGLTTTEMTGTGDGRASANMTGFDSDTWEFNEDTEEGLRVYPVLVSNKQDPLPYAAIQTSSSSKSYYIKATATGNGTVAPEDEDVSPDSMYKVTKGSDVTFEFDADSGYEVTDVIVNDKSVGACDEYEFENIIDTMQTIEVIFEKSSSSSDEEDEEDAVVVEDEEDVAEILLPFGDVDENNENLGGIAYVYENGLMAGISADVFGSDLSITRGMIAAILFRADGSVPVDAIMEFVDVPADQYYLEAVRWGKAEGIMAGVSAEKFDPDAPITNEQFIVFLYRYATYLGMDMDMEWSADLSGYEMSDYAITAIAWALENGIIDEDFEPMTTAIRGDVATGLMNFMEMM